MDDAAVRVPLRLVFDKCADIETCLILGRIEAVRQRADAEFIEMDIGAADQEDVSEDAGAGIPA